LIHIKFMPKPQHLDSVPVTSLVTVTQTAVGCGIGLLLAGRLSRSAQRNTAMALLSVGAVSVAPLVIDLISRRRNRPESERGMRRRLESIRHDSGISEDAEIF
jgi:hypothetical protein